MSVVAILGAGDLGGAVAQALASRDCVGRVLLVDAAAGVASGKALDIQQSGAVDGFHTRLAGTDDPTAVAGAAVCVIADAFGPPAAEWQGDDGAARLERVLPYSSAAPLVFAGAHQTELMRRAGLESGVRRERIIGTAPEAFASAVRSIVALEARCSPADVMLSVLGAPPSARSHERSAPTPDVDGGFVVPWSEASIGGFALERVLTAPQIARVEARAARLWPLGPYTLGAAAARAVEAVVTSSRRTFSALTLLGGEFGVRNRIGGLPVRLSRDGISAVQVPTLNIRERVRLETALGTP